MGRVLLRSLPLLVILASAILPFALNPLPVRAAWLGTWENRLEVRVPAGSVGSTLTDFPVILYISASSGTNDYDLSPVFDELTADANRKKIAFTTSDGETQCYVEIEKWDDANEQAWLWVKCPSITASENTFYLYYDVDQADNDTYVGDTGDAVAENVWSSNYVAVWHCNQVPDGDSGDLIDSTGNDHDGTSAGIDNDYPDSVASIIGQGIYFDGNSGVTGGHRQWVSVPDADDLSLNTTGYLSMSFWFEPTVDDWYDTAGNIMDYVNFMGKGNTSQFEYVWTVGGENSPNKPYEMAWYSHSLGGSSGNGCGVYHDGWTANSTQLFYAGTFNRGTAFMRERAYHPDEGIDISTNSIPGQEAVNGTAPLVIGGNWAVSQDQYLKSNLDEIHIYNNVPADDWFDAEYENGKDNLLYFGAGSLPGSGDYECDANGDDVTVWWNGSGWQFSASQVYQFIGYYGSSEAKCGGLYIFDVDIPANVTITNATIELCSDGWSYANDDVNTRITGVLSQNLTAPTDLAEYQALRGTLVGGANNDSITAHQVDWDTVEAWAGGNAYHTSPSIVTVVQDIADLGALTRIGIFVDDHDGRSTESASVCRPCESWDNGTERGALLHLAWTTGTTPPSVATSAATSIEDTTAALNGNLTSLGTAVSVVVSFEYGINITYGSTAVASESPMSGTGAFHADVIDLPTGTTIHFRTKAVGDSTVYGDDATFLTKPAAPTNVSATDGDHTDKVTITWTKSTGATDYHVFRGVIDLGAAGDVATYDDTGADAPTITAGTTTASDGASQSYVTLSLAGESANDGTTHSYTVVASNATGDSGASSADNGYIGVGSLTYQWQRSAADSDASYSNITGATTDPYNDTAAPEDGSGRYFRCVLDATGASQQTSTADRGYRDVATPPASSGTISNYTGMTTMVLVAPSLMFVVLIGSGVGTTIYGVNKANYTALIAGIIMVGVAFALFPMVINAADYLRTM